MANWISSKLKVAETIFEQIDQQAAESLKKNEKAQSEDQKVNIPAATKGGGVSLSLKDQLKKKKSNESGTTTYNYQKQLNSDPNIGNVGSNLVSCHNNDVISNNTSSNKNNITANGSGIQDKEAKNLSKASKPTLTDSDWTELLSTPSQPSTSSSPKRSNLASVIRGVKKDFRRQGSSRLVAEVKKNEIRSVANDNVAKSVKALNVLNVDNKRQRKPSDAEESSSSSRSSGAELQGDRKVSDNQGFDRNDVGADLVGEHKKKLDGENGGHLGSKDSVEEDTVESRRKSSSSRFLLESGNTDDESNWMKEMGDIYDKSKSSMNGKHRSSSSIRSSVTNKFKGGSPSTSGSSSDSDSSGSSSDSESEREKERRRKIFAQKVAVKAVEAIKDRENMIARFEGEKQSLEKILEERAKQQAQEASELQTSMMETMDAVDLEKQKHNNTRMEALARLAQLETANADLARSLASAQKNLEFEIDWVAELRQQSEVKEVAIEELRRRISKAQQTADCTSESACSRGLEFEREVLEAEYSILTDKLATLEDKAKKLEADIEMTRKEMEEPTEVELELKRRLNQLTDHLIQKQAQVETLSAEKATLSFRIETVSRMLDENKSSADSSDLESGSWDISHSSLQPMFKDKIRSGKKHLGSLIHQLDAIFLAGVVFLRRNSAAKLWSIVYLVCLHLWVMYILMSKSRVSEGKGSGAVVSLENLNNTGGLG